jgi:tellurite resistance protein
MIDQQTALVYTMVLASAADSDMSDAELEMIDGIVRHLPVFEGYDAAELPKAASACVDLLSGTDGLDAVLNTIRDSLPERLRETAYALACDTVAADREASQEELRLLEMLRHRLDVDRLTAAAIERGAGARFARA